MNSAQFIEFAQRDAVVIDALHRALYAMALTTGCAITGGEISGTLHFEKEIASLRSALHVLGIDTTQPLPKPSRRR